MRREEIAGVYVTFLVDTRLHYRLRHGRVMFKGESNMWMISAWEGLLNKYMVVKE